jgi:hypothetical protein
LYNKNRNKKNKTFDYNITNNINNKKEINNNRTINISKNHKNKNIYPGSKFNLVKGNIHLIKNFSKKIPKNNINNINNNNKLYIRYFNDA